MQWFEQSASSGPDATTEVPASMSTSSQGSRLSLRAKGFIAFVAVALYAVLMTVFTYSERTELLVEFVRLQKLHEIEDRYRQVDEAAFHILVSRFSFQPDDEVELRLKRFEKNFALLKQKHAALVSHFPSSSLDLSALETLLQQALQHPSEQELAQLNQALLALKQTVSQRIDQTRQEQKQTSERYRTLWDRSAIMLLSSGLLGLVVLGAIIGMFFARLTDDLNILKIRALDIVHGGRDMVGSFQRNDEVGELMQAVNYLASALDEREKELVMARQRYFYQEKMAAVGALAAGVAHEIGNPIAAMSGVLQDMIYDQQQEQAERDERVEILQSQVKRLSAIIREISSFASPQSAERDLLDLNHLLRTDSSLMSYDKRMRQVNLELNLDEQLPAIYGVADQLTQVIMNLLINAADAMDNEQQRPKVIRLSSELLQDQVRFTVADSGSGMDEETVKRVFDAFYTTKKRGTGLGLALCHSIITEHGGTIEIDSTPEQGTTIQVTLPVDPRTRPRHEDDD